MAMLSMAMIRICANACITRYERGEGTIEEILGSYTLDDQNRSLVKAEIYVRRPELAAS